MHRPNLGRCHAMVLGREWPGSAAVQLCRLRLPVHCALTSPRIPVWANPGRVSPGISAKLGPESTKFGTVLALCWHRALCYMGAHYPSIMFVLSLVLHWSCCVLLLCGGYTGTTMGRHKFCTERAIVFGAPPWC